MLANTWATGSNFTAYFPEAVEGRNTLDRLEPSWQRALRTAESTSYRNRSRTSSGPDEFQTAEAIMENGSKVSKSMQDIGDAIIMAGAKIPELSAMIDQYNKAVLHGGKGDPDKLRGDILETAQDVYATNFARGFDVYPFSWGMIILLTLAGAAVGALAGAGVDTALERYEARQANKKRREGDSAGFRL